jgi:tetratricopeptide (TPR) repeat protein
MKFSSVLLILFLSLLAGCSNFGNVDYIKRGNQSLAAGDYQDAEFNFRGALKRDAASAPAYLGLGRTLNAAGKPIEAYAVLGRALELAPDSDEALAALAGLCAEILLASGEISEPVYLRLSGISARMLEKDPNSSEGLLYKGYLAIAEKQPGRAAAAFRQAYEADSSRPLAASLALQSLLFDGQSKEAEEFGLRALEKHPEFAPLADGLYFHFLNTNRAPDAQRILERKIAANPKVSLYAVQLIRHYHRSGQAAEMAVVIDRLPRDYPDGALALGDYYLESRDLDSAFRAYQSGLAANPGEELTYKKRLAGVILAQGKGDDGARLLDEIIRRFPADQEAQLARASLRLNTSDLAEAQKGTETLRGLVAKNPGSIDLRYSLSRAYRRQGLITETRRELISVLHHDGFHYPAIRDLARLNLEAGRFDEAAEYAARGLAIQPANPELRLVQTAVYAMNDNRARARTELRQLATQYPDLNEAHLQLALLNAEEGKLAEAEAIYRKFYKPGETSVRILRGMTEMYLISKQGAKAVGMLEAELKARPEAEDVRRLLAATAGRTGQYDLAIEHFRWLTERRPESADLHAALAVAHQVKGDWPAAIAAYQGAVKADPQSAVLAAGLGYAYKESGRNSEAIAQYRKALELQPDYPLAMNNLAVALADGGQNIEEAMRLCRKATTLAPENPVLLAGMGYVHWKAKDLAMARQAYRSAIARDAAAAGYQVEFAEVLIESGEKDAARQALEAARKANPAPAVKARIEELLASLR